MADPYFLVSKYPDENNPTDIAFTPVNKKTIPKDYLRFKSDVEAFIATINALFSKDKDTQSQFYEEVYYAAELCFSGDKSDFLTATQTLDEIKDKLTSSYWAKVRDGILIKYGSAVFWLSLPLVLGFYVFGESYKFYFMSLIGTCVGSWLSLAIRTKQLVFDDIRHHISEVTSPFIRCIFACVLSFVFLMLLKVGFVEIKLGSISSKDISANLEVALTLVRIRHFPITNSGLSITPILIHPITGIMACPISSCGRPQSATGIYLMVCCFLIDSPVRVIR